MGCDIHLFKEYQDNMTKEWQSYDTWYQNEDNGMSPIWTADGPGRCYAAFGLLANVREEYSYSYEAKGLPLDACRLVREESDSWGSDAHSHSYLTKIELNSMIIKLSILPKDAADDVSRQKSYVFALLRLLEEEPVSIELHDEAVRRIVFWFDN